MFKFILGALPPKLEELICLPTFNHTGAGEVRGDPAIQTEAKETQISVSRQRHACLMGDTSTADWVEVKGLRVDTWLPGPSLYSATGCPGKAFKFLWPSLSLVEALYSDLEGIAKTCHSVVTPQGNGLVHSLLGISGMFWYKATGPQANLSTPSFQLKIPAAETSNYALSPPFYQGFSRVLFQQTDLQSLCFKNKWTQAFQKQDKYE